MLVNDISELDELFYLAIDDYHLIRNEEVHHFLTKLFEYPQPFFRLIIITRRDPELPLPEWRSKNKLVEIRSSNLKFSREETREFLEKAISYHPDDAILSKLMKATDGWVSGLRMLMLSIGSIEELQQNFVNFSYKNSRVINELVYAVLSRESEIVKDKLIRLSILKEFNADLFSELCLEKEEKDNKEELFDKFISDIIRSNMFIISLDDKHNWYRFHHLFIEQLFEVLQTEYSSEKIVSLRSKAADWYRENDILDNAIEYYLNAGQISEALGIFTEYRFKLISIARNQHLEFVFKLFPDDVVSKNGILLLTRGWLLLQKGNIPEMDKQIDKLEDLLINENHHKELLDPLLGEVHAMKAFSKYLSGTDMKEVLEHCSQTIKLIKDQNPNALGLAWVYYGAALQIVGRSAQAKQEIYKELETCSIDILRGQLFIILCFLDWLDGDLSAMIKTGKHLLQLGLDSGIKYLIANANILIGIAYYFQNNDDEALRFLQASNELRYFTYKHMSFGPGMALANIYSKTNRVTKSNDLIHAYEVTALKDGGKLFINTTQSASAELVWKYQNDESGLRWAKQHDYKDFLPIATLYSPEIVQARILALDDDPTSHKRANDIIKMTIAFFEKRNDFNVLIRAFVIQAVLQFKTGNLKNAFETLDRVVNLSSAGNFIRPYLELGESMRSLLQEYKKTVTNNDHLDEILEQFLLEASTEVQVILTIREKEILNLAEAMTNKEVANQLFITEKTVKGHITNINKKLNVSSKLEAVAKAKELILI